MKFVCLLLNTIVIASVNFTAHAQNVDEPSKKSDVQSEIKSKQTERADTLTLFNLSILGNKISQMQDIRASGYQLARIADLFWEQDEIYARDLFTKALNQTSIGENDAKESVELKAVIRRQVLSLIAKRDSDWAEKIIDSSTEQAEKGDRYCFDEVNLDTARGLVDANPKTAAKFAERSLQKQISPNFITFLQELRRQDRNGADNLFLQVLSRYIQQPDSNAYDLVVLGTYLFAAPGAETTDVTAYAITRVGNIGVPNISVIRQNISANLIRSYLTVAAESLVRQTADDYQRQLKYALGYLILPQARQFAPDLTGKISAGMSSLASNVPAGFTSEEAFSNLNPDSRPSSSDRIEKNKENTDKRSRDITYLDVAFQAWSKGDFVNARRAVNNMADEKAAGKLRVLMDFGEANALLKKKSANLADVEQIANRLPNGIESGLLRLAIASSALKLKNNTAAYENLTSAAKITQNLSDPRSPYLLLGISAYLNKINPQQASSTLSEAIAKFNQSENSGERLVKWEQEVTIEPLTLNFPLSTGVSMDFENLVKENTAADETITPFDNLKSELLRAKAYVTIAKKLVDSEKSKNINNQKNANQNETVDVGEDGIRRSAAKTVMPVYPEASLKNKAKGVAVAVLQYDGNGNVTDAKILESPDAAIGQAVLEAVKQWKFNGSKLQNKPINVRGKLTFYFLVDAKGKGEVKNPKQYQ